MSRVSAIGLVLISACATTPPPAATRSDPAPAPAAERDELALRWDESTQELPELRPTAAAPVDASATFRAALTEAQSALKAKRPDAALEPAERALALAAQLDGEARFHAHRLHTSVQLGVNGAQAALESALHWRASCGPEKLDACRTAAMTAAASAGKRLKDTALQKRVRELQDADLCAVRAERGAAPNPCEPTALRVSQREKDPVVPQRLAVAQALREPNDVTRAALLDRAEQLCSEGRCAGARRKALTTLLAWSRAKADLESTVKWALREVALAASQVPESNRLWARTATLDQACLGYDAAHGPGSCRALERKTLGYWTFHDYSRQSAGQGLSPDQVKRVNEHFSPLLQRCLAEQARRMTPPDAQRYEVRWVVLNDGRVKEAHLRKDLDDTALATCLRTQFEGWRYPTYEGELQNVEQAFTVTAVERAAR